MGSHNAWLHHVVGGKAGVGMGGLPVVFDCVPQSLVHALLRLVAQLDCFSHQLHTALSWVASWVVWGEKVWVMFRDVMKFLKSSLLKEVALSVQMILGSPYLLKASRRAPTMWWDAEVGIGTATGYLERLQRATGRWRPPGIGPKRSIYTVCHGRERGGADAIGALDLSGTKSWHLLHSSTQASTTTSIAGKQSTARMRLFIEEHPRCASPWASLRRHTQRLFGTTTRSPRRMVPLLVTVSS